MSLTACSLLQIAYHHVPKNLSSCAPGKCVGSYHVLILEVIPLVGKNCSRNSICHADLAFTVWDACYMTFLLTYTHGNKSFSLTKSVSTPLFVILRVR